MCPTCSVTVSNDADLAQKACIDTDLSQPLPPPGWSDDKLSLDRDSLRDVVKPSQAIVYRYVIATVKWESGRFVQYGSAPNFQGGMVTLCTCKHRMRTSVDSRSWEGRWLAGFSGTPAVGDGKYYLVYLMQVKQACESQAEMWDALPEDVREAKAADLHRLGDLYRPKPSPGEPLDRASYIPPCKEHSHALGNAWHNDIVYAKQSVRPPSLLVGDPEQTFLWDRPLISVSFNVPRPYTYGSLDDFLGHLVGADGQ